MAERNRNDLMEMAKALGHGDFVYRHGEVPLFTRAQGCVLEESSGKKFLDAEAANGTAGLGFDSGIVAATQETLKDLPALPSFCESELRCRVASSLGRLLDRATGAKGRIAFELGGAQGIELALKIVRANSLGTQFAVFEGGYHGRSGFASQFSASHRYRQAVGEWRLPIVRLPYPDCEQCRFSRKRTHCNNECIAFADGLISSEIGGLAARGSLDVAALLIEPVLNAGGIVWPDPQYLEAIVDRMRERGRRNLHRLLPHGYPLGIPALRPGTGYRRRLQGLDQWRRTVELCLGPR
jgi:4-aminobutyrate aminotransferase-like enzyme